jgi:WD40 repeat protein
MKIRSTVLAALKVVVGVVLSLGTIYVVLGLTLVYWPRLSGGTRGKHAREQKRYAALFKAGDPNVPLLAMDWFSEHGVYFCRVSQTGRVNSARDVGYAIQGGSGISSRFSFDNTNRALLEAAINRLPASSKRSLPRERQILVSGVQSNHWIARVYDRANVPVEVEHLYDLTGAYLGWFIPLVGARPTGVAHSMSQRPSSSLAIATDASIAASIIANVGFQVWNLKDKTATQAGRLDKLPYPWKENANNFLAVAALSPDGKTVIFAVRDVLFAVDRQSQALLWEQQPMAWGNTYRAGGRTLAMGNRGRSLFIAEDNKVQRWDLSKGIRLGTLATNVSGIKFLKTSWDGEVLIAGFGDNSFTLWETAKDEPVFHFAEPEGASSIALSPDGQRIILNAFGQRKLVVYAWRRGERSEFPLRIPYASSSAYSMCWSPDGKRLAADIDTYPSSLIIYETSTWKPIADWPCGAIGTASEYVFNKQGTLFQLIDGEVHSLDAAALRGAGD